ncbi:hypothetical protein [Couchioplanes azureus]|uniref:hypothetical protein n=1 Tax=Couchioplanes caeruleus TaxID=56438 RepID=UPI00167016BE|nr:hypothetical protein [Couchioplanes caeruleus]GGQ87198.1 hypothetical protein GCM10010166_66650 [Couchioplanes caeruleus subsp. azureus]
MALVVIAMIFAVLAGAAPSRAAVAPVPLTTPERCVTLTELGLGAVSAERVTKAASLARFSLSFPDGAVQGEPNWYLVRLHVRITAPAAAKGQVFVSADTNERVGARADFRLSPGAVDFVSASLTAPVTTERIKGRTADVRLENYLQFDGVRGGIVPGEFRVEPLDGARLDKVEVLPDTCFMRTALTPETLKVETQTQPAVVRPGDRVKVRVGVVNTGTRPVSTLTVSARPAETLQLDSPSKLSTTGMTGRWEAEFTYTARAAGEHVVAFDIGTDIQPLFYAHRVTLDVSDGDGGMPGWLLAVGALVALGAVVVWLFVPSAPR